MQSFTDYLNLHPLVEKVLFSVILLAVGMLAIRILMVLVKRTLESSKLEKAAHTLILSLCRVVLYLLLGLCVASMLGIDVTGIVALASVLTLSLSLALQNMLGNVMGGFTILSTTPFHSGDYVEIAGQGGTVQEINMTYTKLCTPDNKVISIPNSAVVASQIVNYSAQNLRRVDVNVSASYEAPLQLVLDSLLRAAEDSRIAKDPAPGAVVLSYGDSAVNYSLRVWVKTAEYWDVFFDLNRRVKEVFDEAGVSMTYPHLNVHLEK